MSSAFDQELGSASRDWGYGAGSDTTVFVFLTGGSCMGWILRLVETGPDITADGVDLIEIDRPTGLAEIANLGLTLSEAKQVLARMQRALVAAQAHDHAVQRPGCSSCNGICHIKDWRPHQIAIPGDQTIVWVNCVVLSMCARHLVSRLF